MNYRAGGLRCGLHEPTHRFGKAICKDMANASMWSLETWREIDGDEVTKFIRLTWTPSITVYNYVTSM